MSALNHSLLLGSGAGDYRISRSLRFNAPDSASLSRTLGTAGSTTAWTWACWVKRIGLSVNGQVLLTAGSGVNNNTRLSFGADDRLSLVHEVNSVSTTLKETAAVYRDPGAWMHIVCAVNTNTAAASNRVRLYVNGTEVTVFNANNAPSVALPLFISSANTHYIGQSFNPIYASFYLADVNFVDGNQLPPTAFGGFDDFGQWQPKAYTRTYGTNGYKLDFADNSATTATTLGKDRFGTNDWTPTNFSVTAGADNDSLVDSPTSYGIDTGIGGEVRGNYCTFNPIKTPVGSNVFSDGNLKASSTSGLAAPAFGGFGMGAGKWYFEVQTLTAPSGWAIGVATNTSNVTDVFSASSFAYVYRSNGFIYLNGVLTSSVASYGTAAIIGVAYNGDNGELTFYRNGISQGVVATLTPGTAYFPVVEADSNGTYTWVFNFGQRPYTYAAPSGFKALCDTNLPASTIAKPSTAMDVVTYTGTGASLTPTSSLEFSPSLVWIKSRSAATDNTLYDSVRGVQARLELNNVDAEVTADNGLTAFNSKGFTLGTLPQVNTSAATYSAWCWDAGSNTVTNTAGSISSQVRANPSTGFSVITYTGTGVNATVGHGLGVAPGLIIVKNRTSATNNWAVWHSSLAATDRLWLNTSDATQTGQNATWNGLLPNGSIFNVGTNSNVNSSANAYVAYCFGAVTGYSTFRTYVGNGSADGPYVYCRFVPKWIMIKRSDLAGNWTIIDTARVGYNVDNNPLYPNLVDAEGSTDLVDIVSNGFKLRTTDASVNASAGTYIFVAFAEFPALLARAR